MLVRQDLHHRYYRIQSFAHNLRAVYNLSKSNNLGKIKISHIKRVHLVYRQDKSRLSHADGHEYQKSFIGDTMDIRKDLWE